MESNFCEISETRDEAYWIGLKDMVGDSSISSYKWVRDGSSITYQNWAPGEPWNPNDTCVARYVGGKWDDVPCTIPFGAICEVDVCITISIHILQMEAKSFDPLYFPSLILWQINLAILSGVGTQCIVRNNTLCQYLQPYWLHPIHWVKPLFLSVLLLRATLDSQ